MNSIKRYFSTIISKPESKKVKVDDKEKEETLKTDVNDLSPNSIVSVDAEIQQIKPSSNMKMETPSESTQPKGKDVSANNKDSDGEKKAESDENLSDSDGEKEDATYNIEDDLLNEEEDEDEDEEIVEDSNAVESETVDNDFRKWAMERSPEEKPSSNIDTLIQKAVCFVEEMEKDQEPEESSERLLKQPKSLTAGKLYPYQIDGINWMRNLFENGSHGLLADEMGLGKTIQVIGLYASLRENNIWGPVLIIAPLSTLGNWVKEFNKWTPDIQTILYHGTKEEREAKQETIRSKIREKTVMNRPVVITSYDICRIDEEFLKQFTWFYIVVDEGHRLKNHNSALMKVLFTFAHNPNTSRLLLTGTPLQNNLKELWSLLNFLLPDVFVSPQQFITWFDFSQTKEEQYRQNLINTFRQVLSPFFLRRTKQEINVYLPPKREFILYLSMSPQQKKLYDIIFKQGEEYRQVLNNENCCLKTKNINNIIMRLRQCCCHPSIIYEERNSQGEFVTDEQFIQNSGKLHVLDILLKSLYKEHHRVLLFTQFKEMIHIFEDFLTYRNYKYKVLDGSVSQEDRQRDIDEFSDPSSDYFLYLLTTRAGGQGINLSAADTCIIYDSDWNPQMDIQAMDRCHRLGQKKPVAVFRLITMNSIDIHMLRICEDKKILEKIITHKTGNSNKLGRLSYSEYRELIETNKLMTEDVVPITDKQVQRLARVHARLSVAKKGKGWEIVQSQKASVLDTINK